MPSGILICNRVYCDFILLHLVLIGLMFSQSIILIRKDKENNTLCKFSLKKDYIIWTRSNSRKGVAYS